MTRRLPRGLIVAMGVAAELLVCLRLVTHSIVTSVTFSTGAGDTNVLNYAECIQSGQILSSCVAWNLEAVVEGLLVLTLFAALWIWNESRHS